MDKYLSVEILEKYDVFNVEGVKWLQKRYIEGEDYLYNKLWKIIILNQWFEKNVS